ncbi:hypothetical protein F4803DRAFT_420505 [Xylaria telfairii]|nr:hypothetical protein F4803DRAFT_420505 [Xylaria telfairii]
MAYNKSDSALKLHQSFTTWVDQNYATGLDGTGSRQQYIPYAKLQQYGDHERVKAFFDIKGEAVDIHKLRDDYLLVFFILVYITGPDQIWTDYFLEFYHQAFNDSRLPLPKPPEKGVLSSHDNHSPFPHTSDGINAWHEFYEHQWRFLAPCFNDSGGYRIERIHTRTELDTRHIIPVTFEEELPSNEGSSARILKVSPQESSGLPSTSIIMKEYSKSESEYEFLQARQTYRLFNDIADSQDIGDGHYLRYYGSFVQANKCVILVEYADRGTLLDWFRQDQFLPRNELEARALWKSLSMLFSSLEIIHRRGKNNLAIRQEIKPDNVFAFNNPKEPQKTDFKFGDLGLSRIRGPSSAGDAVGHHNYGSNMYSAPETRQFSGGFQELASDITWAINVWPLGCLFFETAVWMAAYERGRQKFREARVNETAKIDTLVRAGYYGAFHNGFDILPTLTDKVHEISNLNTPVGRLSVKVMEFILEEMLVPQPQQCPNADQLGKRFRRMLKSPVSPGVVRVATVPQARALDEIQSPIDHGEGGTVDGEPNVIPLSRHSHDPKNASKETGHPPQLERPPLLTISQVIEWIPRAKQYNEKLDGIEAISKDLSGRRQVFVIDNSESMGPHWTQVKRTAHALSYLVKRIRPEGFDIHITNSEVKIRSKKTKKLFDDNGLLERYRPRATYGPCRMERVLSDILLTVVNEAATRGFRYTPSKPRRVRGVDVYILTNAVWEPNSTHPADEANGVEHAIEAAAKRVRYMGLPRHFLAIQFIRFGQDSDGIRRLLWLNNHISDITNGWDIVDTTDNEGSVRKMLIGSKPTEVSNSITTVTDLKATEMPPPTPIQLKLAISTANSHLVHTLLKDSFLNVAIDEYEWLTELQSLGYSTSEIADILLEKSRDGPCVFSRLKFPDVAKFVDGFHQKGCVHSGLANTEVESRIKIPPQRPFLSHIPDDGDASSRKSGAVVSLSSLESIEYFCGIGGVKPTYTGVAEMLFGFLTFEDDNSTAISALQDENTTVDVLMNLDRAAGILQQLQGCCDSFTFLWLQQSCAELVRMDLGIIRNFDQVPLERIIPKLSNETPQLRALAAQLLSLAFLSYSQAHCGATTPFFLDTSLSRVILIGNQEWAVDFDGPCIVGSLVELSCFGAMLQQPVFTFRYFDHYNRETIVLERGLCLDLLATPEDILDTWGPGGFLIPKDDKENLYAISIGGGLIAPISMAPMMLHWSLTTKLDPQPTMMFHRRTKARIGATVSLNDNCQAKPHEQLKLAFPMAGELGTFPGYWEVSERQLGTSLQAGQGAVMTLIQFNQTWVKRRGLTKKSKMLAQNAVYLADLDGYFGIQVSVCTGIARRVRLRDLLADILPAYVSGLVSKPPDWKVLLDNCNILHILREGDLSSWLENLDYQLQKTFENLVVAILFLLQHTGVDHKGENFIIGCIQPDIPFQCFSIPCRRENYWARIVADSEDIATFAYVTTGCLETDVVKCQGSGAYWTNSTGLFLTAVSCYEDELLLRTANAQPSTTVWTLKDSEAYHIGRLEAPLLVQVDRRVHEEPRLLVSVSMIGADILRRLYMKASSSKLRRLRERGACNQIAESVTVLASTHGRGN